MADGELKVGGQDVVVNNRVRRELESAMAGMKLFAPAVDVRRAAVKELELCVPSVAP